MKKIPRLFRLLRPWEKGVFFGLLAVILFSALMLVRGFYLEKMIRIPAEGGTLIEGILDNPDKISAATERLTQSGLLRFDSNGNLMPDLAERWEISADAKQFKFYLRKDVDAPRVALLFASLKELKNLGEIKSGEGNVIEVNLYQPYGSFLKLATLPFYPVGPYQISQKNKAEITFEANDNYYLGRPYLKKIIFRIYQDQAKLDADLKRHAIMAGLSDYQGPAFNHFNFPLARRLILFFNLDSEALKDKTLRGQLKNGEATGKDLSLNLFTLSTFKKEAEEIKQKFESRGVKIEIFYHDAEELQKEIIPKRSYDLLLYGVDFGPDSDDYYPFFHSSQIGANGLNLASFNNKSADKLLEEMRKTSDETARQQKLGEFAKILDSEVPVIMVEQYQAGYTIRDMVGGVNMVKGINESDRFAEVWNWYIKTKKIRSKN